MLTRFDMTLGAVGAILLDYAAVAFVVGLLLLDRWLGMRRGITLDTLLVLMVALSAGAWIAGSWFKGHLHIDQPPRTDITRLRPAAAHKRPDSR